MKLKSLFMLIMVSLVIGGCSTSNMPKENPRLAKSSTYSLSIYATDRANINIYSPKDDKVAVVSDEVDMEYIDELDIAKGQLKRPITIDEYKKNITANSSNADERIIEQEKGKADARATPVMLKVFQLTDKSLFLSSTYDDFRGNDFTESLGKTYISNIDLIITPNQFRFIEPESLDEKAHYIGVVALYNSYENRKWKGVVQVKPKGGESYPLLIRVLDSKVEIYKDN
ncbi:type VI secretion system lipoprotein TssJ [Actinobacillus equuli]|uniref:type VI secretion system lipoprotein TssJ n=1 Tax=Actinobacillus equuli TaxID=718 RepID=UPI0024436E68|nr:type VI secretion system lipoprotein TssJ [Actinobacillus equuli]WGE53781.1 type VI secretion system lipoprotein TssJ [Actinobacillus equuli subsp. haemolyticus]